MNFDEFLILIVLFITGLPDALHSKVTVLPFLAETCPFCGTALNVGGTK